MLIPFISFLLLLQAAASLRDRDNEVDRLRAAQAQQEAAAAASSAHSLGPHDTTLQIKWLKLAHPTLTSSEALSTFLAVLLAPSPAEIDSVVVTKPKEGKKPKAKDKGSAVVAFKTLSAAVRLVDRAREGAGDKLWEGVEVSWAGGRPEVLGPEPVPKVGGHTAAPTPPLQTSKPPTFASSFPTSVSRLFYFNASEATLWPSADRVSWVWGLSRCWLTRTRTGSWPSCARGSAQS